MADQFFIYENRLASFRGPQPIANRASNAPSRAPKALLWPHKFLSAEDLAKAGFFFNPQSLSPDNVECFLCHKSLDGWEEGDDPVLEHLKHARDCGWAIVAAIEAENEDLEKVDPRDPRMVEARKATFGGRWPYEGKKGWKCKTKQLVEAGWKYTPTLESDDNTTCTYCQLALDGWEAGDKPMDEHSRRAPNCPFFVMVNSNPAPKKAGRTKAARGSKVSRLSIQSIATAISDIPSVSDLPADVDDSVLTTTSVMTQGKKATKGRKPAASKGRKARAKKDEAIEILEDPPMENVDVPPPPPPKATRGRKRGSDAMDDSVITNAEAPAPKKRATRARENNAVDASVLTIADTEMTDSAPPSRKVSGRKKGGAADRKVSGASIRSTASTASLRAHVSEDDELDRQLQADLDRPLTDDEGLAMDSDSERRKEPASQPSNKKNTGRKRAATHAREEQNNHYAMFDPAPVQHDDAAVEAELQAMQTEMDADKDEEPLQVPKKGRKAGTRKASKQTAAKKGKAILPQDEEDAAAPVQCIVEPEADQVHNDSSKTAADTVTKSNAAGRGRGRPPKKSAESHANTQEASRQPPAPETVPSHITVGIEHAPVRGSFSALHPTSKVNVHSAVVVPTANTTTPIRSDKALPPPPPQSGSQTLSRPPATPRANHISPAPSARQAALSPSQSPQSSDAENQPPSSKPTTSAAAKRVVLAPVAATPVRGGSPSKRNVIAGLRSTTPWTAADLDHVFGQSPFPAKTNGGAGVDKENGVGRLLREGADLTSPEKAMTVDEWMYHNAGLAEQRLKHECEAMVSAFEREGGRAMEVLEGLVVD